MQSIQLPHDLLYKGAKIIGGGSTDAVLLLPASGGGLKLPQLIECKERYLTFYAEVLEDHSLPMKLIVNLKPDGETPGKKPLKDVSPVYNKGQDVMFGLMPRFKTLVCLDLKWLDGHILFPGNSLGQLKVVRHGGRILPEEIEMITLETVPVFHDVTLRITDLALQAERPKEYPIPDIKLIDEFGQNKRKDWPGKVKSLEELKSRLQKALEVPDKYGPGDWNKYGGWKNKKLSEGTGYFGKIKKDGRWWITDPEGCAFFSIGPCAATVRKDCRVDGLEKLLDWLPARDDPEYGEMFLENEMPFRNTDIRHRWTAFSFEQANLYKVFGKNWQKNWKNLIIRQLKKNGMNCLGNRPDPIMYNNVDLPYVVMLDRFPETKNFIFRDFPDVLSEEYEADAAVCAKFLEPLADSSYLVGFFMRNEPAWAFVENLIMADEVLYNPWNSGCKEKLIEMLKNKYKTPETLSKAWNHSFDSFEDLKKPLVKASAFSAESNADLREFSRLLLKKYVEIPAKACRKVDPHHMNLGMRWAWISDPDLVSGWENFDIFSINCYAVDPTPALDNIVRLGVDLPIMIGEFHFGALDGPVSATGLEGVENQEERGKAYRYYAERVAAHPYGVSCHWFQCYDQFELGRFDGENYDIGLFDLCSLPNEAMMKAAGKTGDLLYRVMEGSVKPSPEKPKSIPMIAY
jgi:hypothetical protein